MSTNSGVSQGKTAFVEEFLSANGTANFTTVNEAWKSAGNEGTVSESLVNKARSRLKLTGKRGTNGRTKAGSAGKAKSPKGSKAARIGVNEAPPRADGPKGGARSGKTAFVEDLLARDPKANVKAINRAWAAAGNAGTISDSSVYKTKRDLGLSSGRSRGGAASAGSKRHGASGDGPALTPRRSNGRGTSTATASASESRTSGGSRRLVDEVEAGIDDLMFTLKVNGGMPEVEAALRAARRLLTRGQGE